jgi:hypothetical protein
MDVYSSSSGLQQVVGYGPHSVVIAHNNHHNGHSHDHHQHNGHTHYHSLPPRSLPKAASSYQLVPIVPTTIYVPIEQPKQQQYHGNRLQ